MVFHALTARRAARPSWTSSSTGCAGGWPTGGSRWRSPTRPRHWLAEHGYDPIYGARPLRRLVQSAIGDRLAKALLAGEIRDGDTVVVDLADGKDGLVIA